MAMGNLSSSAQRFLLFLLLLVTTVVADNVPSLKGEAENRVPNEGGQGDGNARADVNENNESYSDSNDDTINDDCVSSYSDGDTGSGSEYTDTGSEYNSDDYYTDSGSESDTDDSEDTDSGSESDDDDSSDAMDDEDVDIADEEDGRYYKKPKISYGAANYCCY